MAIELSGNTEKKSVPKAKKLVKKLVIKKSKEPEPEKVKKSKEPEKVKKSKVVPKTVRKINKKPVLAKTTGLNISPAKVKNIVSNHVLNKDAHSALTELKMSRPRDVKTITKKDKDGKETTVELPASKGTPVNKLSESTQTYVAFATKEFERSQKDDYAKCVVNKMVATKKTEYNTAKSKAKDAFDVCNPHKFLSDKGSQFDLHAFNIKFDPKFYNDLPSSLSGDINEERKRAINVVTKLKNRFSTNSRVFISAFVEYLIKQMALNGTVCCIADKKKIIQLSHILDTTKDGFEERFPLYPLIVNLETFKQAKKYLANPVEYIKALSGDESDNAEKVTDLFTLDCVSIEKQYQFKYYIAESCRETIMDLVNKETDKNGEPTDIYNSTSVSKIFKNFCSTLVCEFLMRIGTMLKKEIETRGIKTVNDTIINAVISHYHTVCGVEEGPTIDFIREVTTKYYGFITTRQKNRGDDKGDMEYSNDL